MIVTKDGVLVCVLRDDESLLLRESWPLANDRVQRACLNLLHRRYGPNFVKIEFGPGRIAEEYRRPHGTIGLTPLADPFCDIYMDLNGGLPFPDGTIDFIYSNQFLEHLQQNSQIFFWNEMWRVLKSGGRMKHVVPHYLSEHAWGDPTHRTVFSPRTFQYYCQRVGTGRPFVEAFSDYGIEAAFVLEKQEVTRRSDNWPQAIVGEFRKP